MSTRPLQPKITVGVTTWTPQQDARLTELWLSGLSTAAIGAAMAISKNAVIGRAHRLRLPPRASPIKSPRAASRTSLATPRPPVGRKVALTSRPAVPPAAARPVGVALRNLRGSITRNTAPPAPRARLITLGGAAYRTCRYPLWPDDLPRPPRPALFCGAPVAALGCSWCADHHRVVWRRDPPAALASEDPQ